MYIDTTSKDKTEQSLAGLIGCATSDFYSLFDNLAQISKDNCCKIDWFRFKEHAGRELSQRISDSYPDEIILYHLSRRLCGGESDKTSNLVELLTTCNVFSDFLREYDIAFQKEDERIALIFRDHRVNLDCTNNNDPSYLRSRLGYNKAFQDYCVNGFAFYDSLMDNANSNCFLNCPEIIAGLEQYLGLKGLASDYYARSQSYIIKYRFFLDRIRFDENCFLRGKEKRAYWLATVAEHLYYYHLNGTFLDNPIIRLEDNDNANSDCLIGLERICECEND